MRTRWGGALVLALGSVVLARTASADDGRYIVEWRDPARGRAAVLASGGEVLLELGPQRAVAARVPEAAVDALRRHPAVAAIEADPRRHPFAQQVPYGVTMVEAPLVWPEATGVGRTVCVIDSGLFLGHSDLPASGVSGHPQDWSTDRCGHGTHVTGTIAALDDAAGVVGVAPGGPRLHVVKVFGDDCRWAYASTLVDALNQCRAAGANVVNLSLGGGTKSRTEEAAFADAWAAGLLSVAAAGNDGSTRKSYPASYDSVISVAALDDRKQVASFSQRNDQVELAAPGVAVLSTVPWREENTVVADGRTFSGTWIEFAARSAGVGGALVDGGLCGSVGAWSGRVVLCERGEFTFATKVANVQAGGGVAAVVFNDVSGGFSGTLGSGNSSTIPAIGLSREDGLALRTESLGSPATVTSVSESPGSGHEAWSGTSMATPHVAGVAALVWSRDPSWTNVQIRAALQDSAEDLGPAGRDTSTGFGLVRAREALRLLAGTGSGNAAPTAGFDVRCEGLTCTFTDASSDPDGQILSHAWSFGDGSGSTEANPQHTYAAAGGYTVALTVTDDGGAAATTTRTVEVTAVGSAGITLSATGYKVKGRAHVDLVWSGAAGAEVEIHRDGAVVRTTANDGADTDAPGGRGSTTYRYRVCEIGGVTCSPEVSVTIG